MVAIILLIAAAGILAVGNIKGWFADEAKAAAKAENVVGIVNIERKGVSFELEKGAALEPGDKIITNEKSGVVIAADKNTYELAQNSKAVIGECKNGFDMEMESGETFVVLNDGEKFGRITAQGNAITAQGTVFSVNVRTGSMGVYVFEGKVTVTKGDKSSEAEAGQVVSVVGEEHSVQTLQISSLNDFNIQKALEAGKARELCFTEEELNKVLDERNAEVTDTAENAEQPENGDSNSSSSKNPGKTPDNNLQTPGSGNGSSNGNSGSGDSGTQYQYSCIIEIRCDTILDNMENLEPGLEGYVPSNGTILRKTTVGFNEGETVFDVLNRICKAKGIQIEYSYTPMYGSYYIEGINHLYEFSCGPQSGWMYKVNGWFPNYGCSSYKLEDGDSISWMYTCNGLGEDVGGGVFG